MKKLYIAHRKKVFVCLLILAAAALGFAGGRQSMEEEIPPVPSSRTILELREKVSAAQLPAEQGGKSAAAPQRVSDKEEDAVVGLMSLGYTRNESLRAVRRAVEGGAVFSYFRALCEGRM